MEEKPCARCRKAPRYNRTYCKECAAEIKHLYYLRHKEEILAKTNQYKKDHPDKVREQKRRYNQTHDRSEYQRQYRKAHIEKVNARMKDRWWSKRTKPITTTLSVRINISVSKLPDGRYWWVAKLGDGQEYDSEETFSTRLAAWKSARQDLKLFRKELDTENERMRQDVRGDTDKS